jgi:hypothetical protein
MPFYAWLLLVVGPPRWLENKIREVGDGDVFFMRLCSRRLRAGSRALRRHGRSIDVVEIRILIFERLVLTSPFPHELQVISKSTPQAADGLNLHVA